MDRLTLWSIWFLLLQLHTVFLLADQSQVPLSDGHEVTKRIAIVGCGSAGVATLRTFIADLPEERRRGWDFVVFEKRDQCGGIWCVSSFRVRVHDTM